MKPETEQLLKTTLQEIQKEKTNKSEAVNAKKIEAVIFALRQEQKEADPTEQAVYQELLHDWWFLLCQNSYYQTHVFSGGSFNPAYIDNLFILLKNDKRPRFKLDVAIKLGMSLLATQYPNIDLQQEPLFEAVKRHLENLSSNARGESHFVSQLIKQLDEWIEGKLPKYRELTKCYNALILENIAQHGIVSAAEAKERGFCLSSIDGSHSEGLSCTGINLNPEKSSYRSKTLDETLKFVTEDPFGGIFQIPVERDKNFQIGPLSLEDLKCIIQNRIQASVVFIFNHPDLHYSFKDLNCWEQRFFEPLAPKMLQAILVPVELTSIVKQAFPDVPVITVKNTSITMKLSRTVEECLPSIAKEPYSLSVPDYVGGLKHYIEQFKPERFFTHVTRLALEHDMRVFLLPDTPHKMKRLTPKAIEKIFTRKFSQVPVLEQEHSTELLTAYNKLKIGDTKTEPADKTSLREKPAFSNPM